MRIAFFGGSFDPPHLGHVAVAEAAAERCALDLVLMAPVGQQPLKRDTKPSSFADRMAMVRLACEGHPRLETSDVDGPDASSGPHGTQAHSSDYKPNYTYDTLVRLRGKLGAGDQLFCLLGADSFATLRQWHRAAELPFLCDFIVAGRPGFALDRLSESLPAGITSEELHAGERTVEWVLRNTTSKATSTLWLLPDLDYEISATAIRAALDCDATIGMENVAQEVLNPAVARYACEHRLYQTQ
jgi:nicotinate-nucleotide adenylyltransferase